MVIVPALADDHQRQEPIVHRLDGTVVRLVAPAMGRTVHQPREMKRQHVAQVRRMQCQPERLLEAHHVDVDGQNECQQRHQDQIVPAELAVCVCDYN